MKIHAGKHKKTDVLCSFIPHAQELFMHVLTGTGSCPSAMGQWEAENNLALIGQWGAAPSGPSSACSSMERLSRIRIFVGKADATEVKLLIWA